MEKRTCESCTQEAKIMCFCRNALLCERCVGKHLMDEPSLSHKPCTLSSENLKMYEEHIHTLRANEDLLLSEARRRQELTQAYRAKLSEGLQKLKALQPVIIDYVSLAAEVVSKQLPEVAERLGHDMLAACNANAAVLQTALLHFEGGATQPDNPLVQLLEATRSVADVQTMELVTCKLDLGEIDIEPLVRSGIRFEVALKRPHTSKDQRDTPSKVATVSPSTSKTMIPKPIEKKPVAKTGPRLAGKSESKSSQGSTKGLHVLNTSSDRPSDDSSDLSSSRLSKKLNDLKSEHQKRPKAASPPPMPLEQPRPMQIPQVPLKQVTSESHLSHGGIEEFSAEILKAESPSPDPPVQRTQQPAPVYALRRLQTDSQESSLEKSRLTRLQMARSNNRKELLRETEKKVSDIEEQVRGLKLNRPYDLSHEAASEGDSSDNPEAEKTLTVRPEEQTAKPSTSKSARSTFRDSD